MLKNTAQMRAAWADWVASKRAKLALMSGSRIVTPTHPRVSLPAGAGATASDSIRSGTNLTGECTATLLRCTTLGPLGHCTSLASRGCGALEVSVQELLMPGNDAVATERVPPRKRPSLRGTRRETRPVHQSLIVNI